MLVGFSPKPLSDTLNVVVNCLLLYVAFKALNNWREQTQETYRADLVKRLVHETFEVVEIIEAIRNFDKLSNSEALKYEAERIESYKRFRDIFREFTLIYKNPPKQLQKALLCIEKYRDQVLSVRKQLKMMKYEALAGDNSAYREKIKEIWPSYDNNYQGSDCITDELLEARGVINGFASDILRKYYGTESR